MAATPGVQTGQAQADAAEAPAACAHCGLPVPPGLIDSTSDEQFCCGGCRAVYEVIRGCGLDQFYRLRAADTPAGQPARTTERRYDEFDDPVFHQVYCQDLPDGLRAVELYLEGVHCAACVWLVEKLPTVIDGVREARLDFGGSRVRVVWNPERQSLSHIARTLDALGYPPHPARDANARHLRRVEDRRFLVRIAVAAACAGNVMLLAIALYGGQFTGIAAEHATFFRWCSTGIGLVALLWPGSVFFRGAWAALRTRTAHLDLPIAVALAAGGVTGLVNTVLGRGEVYFDSLTVLVLLLLVGRWLQHRQQRWASDAIELLFSITPSRARRVTAEGVRDVPIEAIRPGHVVEVRAGESIPVDGTIEAGQSAVDQSLLTGESVPVSVAIGDEVCAGAVNCSDTLRVRVTASGMQTRVGKLMQQVEQATRSRAPIVHLADRIAGWFVVVVVTLAAATAGLWLTIDATHAADHAIALLIVSCPCALGLATPLALTLAIGRAAQRGILIKGGNALERLARTGRMLLDKTGTLTAGRMALVRFAGPDDLKPQIAALEAHSAHPIAEALVRALAHETDANGLPPAETVIQTTGGGIEGVVAGRRIVIGSPPYVRQRAKHETSGINNSQQALVDEGLTPVLIARDGCIEAVAGLGDPLRPDAATAIEALRRAGWRVGILSGDHPDIVRAVARQLGIPAEDAHGGLSPEDKLARLRANAPHPRTRAARTATGWFGHPEAERETVVMVGDGINDAAALSAAGVGVAVHGGAEASLAAADVYLSRDGLGPLVDVVQSAREAVGVIRRCLGVSLVYNAVGAGLAIAGVINPLAAAVLMPLSSFTVLSLAAAAGRRPHPPDPSGA